MELTEAGLKTILKEQREEYQRYLGVLNENFTSQVKLAAETLGGIQQQLTSIKEIVAKNTEDIEVMKTDVMSIKHMLKQKSTFPVLCSSPNAISVRKPSRASGSR